MTARTFAFHFAMWLLLAILTKGCVESAESVREMSAQQWEGYP